jgi:RHS repeat-associated protein
MKRIKIKPTIFTILTATVFLLILAPTAKAGTVSFYTYDGPGRSVTALIDQSQNIVNTYEYSAFGNVNSSTQTVVNTLQYVGEQYEPEANLIYLRNRYYDPNSGRFISKDILGGALQNPQTTNPYPYCANNPVNFVDSLGLWQFTFMAGGGNGIIITFGNNGGTNTLNGQWNMGAYIGSGQGLSVSLNLKDSGIHEAGTFPNVLAEGSIGLIADANATAQLGADSAWDVGYGIGGNSSVGGSFGVPGGVSGPIFGLGEATVVGAGATTYSNVAGGSNNTASTSSGANSLEDSFATLETNVFGGVDLNATATLLGNVQDFGGATYDQATGPETRALPMPVGLLQGNMFMGI